MDVRCERCRAHYVFDDDQVTPSGLTVQCTHCGHVFRVKKKELVVTVPVRPEELDRPPLPATAAAPRAPGGGGGPAPARPDDARVWRVRQASGRIFAFRELTTLQKWVVEEKVGRDDQLSASDDGSWRRLGDLTELAPFFQVVEAAERGRRPPPPPPPVPLPPVAAPPAPALRPPPPPVPPPAPVCVEVDLGPEDLAPVAKGGRAARFVLALGALAAVAGGVAYLYGPRLFPRDAPGWVAALGTPVPAAGPSSDAVPSPPAAGDGAASAPDGPDALEPADADEPLAAGALAGAPPGLEVAAPDAEASEVAAPVPVPEAAAPAPPPEPVAVVAGAVPASAPAPPAPGVLVAQATRLRERGEVDRALALYGRALELQPRNVAALTGRGLCYLDLETYPPAEASFEAALRVRPDDADALLGLAETYRWQGKRANAIRYYERYLAAHPAGEEANVAHNALAELRK
jgi:predicted Zn finger-like uncharacterized protein